MEVSIKNITAGTGLSENSQQLLLADNLFYTHTKGKIHYTYQVPNESVKNILIKITAKETDTTGVYNYIETGELNKLKI